MVTPATPKVNMLVANFLATFERGFGCWGRVTNRPIVAYDFESGTYSAAGSKFQLTEKENIWAEMELPFILSLTHR